MEHSNARILRKNPLSFKPSGGCTRGPSMLPPLACANGGNHIVAQCMSCMDRPASGARALKSETVPSTLLDT